MAYRITVEYKIVEGHYVFTSEDLEGFLIASKDMEKAFADVAPVMERLLKDNWGIKATVEPLHPISELAGHEAQPGFYTSSHPLDYAVMCAAGLLRPSCQRMASKSNYRN